MVFRAGEDSLFGYTSTGLGAIIYWLYAYRRRHRNADLILNQD